MVIKTIALLVGLVVASVHLAEAQPARKMARIGFLLSGPLSGRVELVRQGLRELGYTEGKDIIIEYRYADNKFDRLPELAEELVRLRVEVIFAWAGPAVQAAKSATKTIPIVMGPNADPVGTGLVASLARPGGNITGVSLMAPDVAGKRLELLKEVLPKLSRVAFLVHGGSPRTPATCEGVAGCRPDTRDSYSACHSEGCRGV